jgi:histidine triad (HIT) family protein
MRGSPRAAVDGNGMQQDPNCIFCKIARGEIPSRKVYEDDGIVAFHDISPIAPVHLLLIPKVHVATLYETTAAHEAVLGRMLALAGRLAREQGANDGFRTIVNTGRVGRQEVMHVHVHVIGGPDPLGPMIARKGSQGD